MFKILKIKEYINMQKQFRIDISNINYNSAIRLKDGRKFFSNIRSEEEKYVAYYLAHDKSKQTFLTITKFYDDCMHINYKINHGKAQKCEINDLIIHDNFVEGQITPEISLNNKTIKL